MHLRSIVLQGFKTFAQRTELVFEGGVTGVLGPNGSGKSNTVDAFKWVLGETRAKDLRGSKMEEVIYGGGARRARAAGAEVTILIDNNDQGLPVDYAEVAISRRVQRNGQSDYSLNGDRVRRRDLMELLSSTGLTTDAYAIVDQRDIEHIVGCTPDQRRLLIEEAAQVRGVKAKRAEAAAQLEQLAGNLTRLEDLRREIEPRLELVRAQAEAAAEAAGARDRLELLRGSIAWEEWRQARDAHRRASAQVGALERRVKDAGAAAEQAEAAYQQSKAELQSAQDRRLQRQQAVAAARLRLSQARHELALTRERAQSQRQVAEMARAEVGELEARRVGWQEQQRTILADLGQAEEHARQVPSPPAAPPAPDPEKARAAAKAAEAARRALESAQAEWGAARSRGQVLTEQLQRLEAQVRPAELLLSEAETEAMRAAAESKQADEAGAELARIRAELKGLDALRPVPRRGLKRLGDVIVAHAGYEAALAATLGPLLDAWVAAGEAEARQAVAQSKSQITVVYPVPGSPTQPGSLLEHVSFDPEHEDLARSWLGSVSLGAEATPEGLFAVPGLVRGGPDTRAQIATRRHLLTERAAQLEPLATRRGPAGEANRRAQGRLGELRSAAGQRSRMDEISRQLEGSRAREAELEERVPALERTANEAAAHAREQGQDQAAYERQQVEFRGEVRRLELERARWQDRSRDLRRQLEAIEREQQRAEQSRSGQVQRAREADARATEAEAQISSRQESAERAAEMLAEVERESPDEDGLLAATARRLVSVEEARVQARLQVSTLSGNLDLQRREAELTAARMEELRSQMPEGRAPEEVPGGKAREREMRQLERRLAEIGPTNPLAEREFQELEERYQTLLQQLQDIAAARLDLERLVTQLRSEEETRYEAVFGAVALSFQEYYQELTGGGRSALRMTEEEPGHARGVEILVQPPRKRLQRVSLLSSGERALTALALVLALQAINPAPFTILDEVDAALDDANVGRFGETLQRLGRERQFMVITHNHATMACCSTLYGVHLDESGSSHLVSVRLEDIAPAGQSRSQTLAENAS